MQVHIPPAKYSCQKYLAKSDQDSKFNNQRIGNMVEKHAKWHHRIKLATF